MGIFFTKFILPILMLFGGLSRKECQQYYDQAKLNTYDIIIVPGVPYEGVKWDTIMKGRIYWAKHLYDMGITKRIMFSGGAVYTPFYEAKIMALYAKAIGIPDSVIYLETKAEHTKENLYYSFKKCTNLGFKKIAFASDPHQCKIMRKFIRHNFDAVAVIPFVIKLLDNGPKLNPKIQDSTAINPDFVSIVDRESFRKRWRGTRGKNINKAFYNNGEVE